MDDQGMSPLESVHEMSQEPSEKDQYADNDASRHVVATACDIMCKGTTPDPCVAARMVLCALKVYLFGGANATQSFNTLYQLDIETSTWMTVDTYGISKPAARYGHTLSCAKRHLVVVGGLQRTPHEERQLQTHQPLGSFSPPPFVRLTDVLTPPNGPEPGSLWSHRGRLTNNVYLLSLDTMTWRGRNVSSYESASPAPPPVCYHSAVVSDYIHDDIIHQFLLTWGGALNSDCSAVSNQISIFDLCSYEWCNPPEQSGHLPSARYGHDMVRLSGHSNTFLLYGGFCVDSQQCDPVVYILQLPETHVGEDSRIAFNAPAVWSVLETSGAVCNSRCFHALHTVMDRVWIFGGVNTKRDICALHCLDPNTGIWSKPLYNGDATLAASGTLVLYNKLLIFGGIYLRASSTAPWTARSLLRLDNATQSLTISQQLTFITVVDVLKTKGRKENTFKLVTIGDSNVGKSCLIDAFSMNECPPASASTVGVDLRVMTLMSQGRLVTVHIWDTAGQEQYMSLTGNYYRNAQGFIIVFDATRRETLDHVRRWIDHIKEHHPFGNGTVKLLVGNKQDLVNDIQVTEHDARLLADQLNAIYLASSARTREGVDTAFFLAVDQMVSQRYTQNRTTTDLNDIPYSFSRRPNLLDNLFTPPSSTEWPDLSCGHCSPGA